MAQGGNGFTLVELLCSIAIIGLLIGLSLPAYFDAQTQAQRAACQVSSKQYIVGFWRGGMIYVIPQGANCLDCHRGP